MEDYQYGWILAFLIALLAINIIGFAVYDSPEVPSAESIASKIIIPIQNFSEIENKVNYLYAESTEEERSEDVAEQLVLDEMDSKDFKKELVSLLEEYDLESYKDISKILVKDIEISLSGEDAEVEVEFKVYFYIDGDEEETEKALFEAIFDVEELDEDESFEDAEAFLDSLEFLKVY